jgi:glycosyltransferase involved in cell wall biosynthesis
LAVDAINLRADARGMGRYVRPLLRNLAARPDIALTLLVREPRTAAAYRAIVGDRIDVAPLSAARARHAFNGVWYPWNGMRFRSSAPALVTINDDFAFAYPARGLIARRREQAPIARAVRTAAHFCTISAWSRNRLVERFALCADRISIVPLAPDAYFSPGLETSPFSEPFVLVVGTGEARKNVGFLIDVFERAFPGRDVLLAVVGNPETGLRARLRAARVPIATLTHVDDERLRRLYRTAAAVAVPSLAEGFGLVAAEAQACGAAVVAANSSALPETVGDAGILLDPQDAVGWTAALRELVGNAESNARYRALAKLRWMPALAQRTTDNLLAALERTVHDCA